MARIEALVGKDGLDKDTVRNPAQLWIDIGLRDEVRADHRCLRWRVKLLAAFSEGLSAARSYSLRHPMPKSQSSGRVSTTVRPRRSRRPGPSLADNRHPTCRPWVSHKSERNIEETRTRVIWDYRRLQQLARLVCWRTSRVSRPACARDVIGAVQRCRFAELRWEEGPKGQRNTAGDLAGVPGPSWLWLNMCSRAASPCLELSSLRVIRLIGRGNGSPAHLAPYLPLWSPFRAYRELNLKESKGIS